MQKLLFNRLFCITSILWLHCSYYAVAQLRKSEIIQYDTVAYTGMVMLNNGEKFIGKMVFNDNEGILRFFKNDKSCTFTPADVLKFELFGVDSGRDRLFYALEYDPGTGRKENYFFAVLKELKEFVVVMKIDRIKTKVRGVLPSSSMLASRGEKIQKQTQTVFFCNRNGEFEPYLKIVEKEHDGALFDYNETSATFINKQLFKKYTGEHFEALVEFAKENDLSFRRRADFIAILEKYEELSHQ